MEQGAASQKNRSEGHQDIPSPAVARSSTAEEREKYYARMRLATHRECKLLETYLNAKYGNQTQLLVGQYAKEQLVKSLKKA